MNDKITCPNCSHQFDVEEALSGQIKVKYQQEYEKKIEEQAKRFQEERERLEKEQEAFESKKEKQNEIFKKRLDQKLAEEISKEKSKIEKSTQESFEQKLKSLAEENEKRKQENKSLREKEVTLMRKENELKEQQEALKIEVERKLLESQQEIEAKAREKERENFELEKLKLLKQIEDNKKLAEEMKRKAEQGSMQLQGEVQELALEELLKSTYPFDEIAEVPKGINGADVIQTVVNGLQQNCGKIVYESKRTKHFTEEWIEKLKQDQITCKADIAVIVTQTMPKDMERFGERNGVWICSFQEVASLSLVLRQMLIKTTAVAKSEENKGDKMELLYAYLTSNEFKQNVTRIVENYDTMKIQLDKEKKAMMKIWSQREKQIWVVQENLSSLFGSIKGIAGNSIDSIDVLELPAEED